MPKWLHSDDDNFPPVDETDELGIIALGGRLTYQRLLSAYARGIFPWPHQGWPLLWFCPDPRFVVKPQELHISQSLKKALKKTTLSIVADRNFLAVMEHCKSTARPGQDHSWITADMVKAYQKLHEEGYAHSIEAYRDGVLVGGLYGVSLGSIFFGESMFFIEAEASKICFVTLAANLAAWGFSLIDCQAHTAHLERFGAQAIDRARFLDLLHAGLKTPSRLGPWRLELNAR